MPRFHCPGALSSGATLSLPPSAARHVQVLRLQPGYPLTLFNGMGGEYSATVARMGRSDVEVTVGEHADIEREPAVQVHIAVGMPANERMDWLVEKATELGVASIQPLQTAHSVVRLSGERAEKKQAHWQAVAVAACEQCGRNRVPDVRTPIDFAKWLALPRSGKSFVLSLADGAVSGLSLASSNAGEMSFLIGPEGGLSPAEEQSALNGGLQPVSLGSRVMRTETAAIAVLAAFAALT